MAKEIDGLQSDFPHNGFKDVFRSVTERTSQASPPKIYSKSTMIFNLDGRLLSLPPG